MWRSDVTQDPFHLGHESFVCHAVGFVDGDHLDGAQIALTCLHQVDQTQWRRHDDLRALGQLLHLLVAIRTAVHGEHLDAAVIADRAEHLGHLQGELAGGHEDEPVRGHRGGRRVDASHHRDAEGERLARAGARTATHVVAPERHGDGLLLDGERASKSSSSKPFVDLLRHTEVGESCRHTHSGVW